MSLTEAHGSQRPRVEGDREHEILAATLEILTEVGFDKLTMDAVAARAKASKATLYRRWENKASLVIEALHSSKEEPPLPDTGTLRGDLTSAFCGMGGLADPDKIAAERPDAVVFNGYVNQYDARPLAARVGERVRIWVLDAGPNRPTAFHVVGGQFDTVWSEGSYLLRRGHHGGSQALALAPSQGGFVELTFPEPGRYPFLSHVMVDAERGAHGAFLVTP